MLIRKLRSCPKEIAMPTRVPQDLQLAREPCFVSILTLPVSFGFYAKLMDVDYFIMCAIALVVECGKNEIKVTPACVTSATEYYDTWGSAEKKSWWHGWRACSYWMVEVKYGAFIVSGEIVTGRGAASCTKFKVVTWNLVWYYTKCTQMRLNDGTLPRGYEIVRILPVIGFEVL